ncbi:MAG TPA: thioredoxin family protein [Candidatus Mcinerneyibacterium sp.]|nr:thioredoxin family protein [Candidatus Mcinerneyibacterium sp.]
MKYFSEQESKNIKQILNNKGAAEYSFDLVLNENFEKLKKSDSNLLSRIFEDLSKLADNFNYQIKKKNKNEQNKHFLPKIIFNDKEENNKITIFGVPLGYQFGTFLESIDIFFNKNIYDFSEKLINKIKKINESITITVFVEKNCEFSPYAVLFAVKAAAVNKKISVEILNIEDITFFKRELGIEGIPTTIIGDKYSFLGIQNDETLIQIIDEVVNK